MIHRKPFLGDPASLPVVKNPEAITTRGKRRKQKTAEYLKNLEQRKAQKTPAGPSRPVHKGPRSRPKQSAFSQKEYLDAMHRKEIFDF